MTLLNDLQKLFGLKQLALEADLASAVEKGFKTAAIDRLIERGILKEEVFFLVIPRRTLDHRIKNKESLSLDESDRAVRVANIMLLAQKVFGDQESAFAWLRGPKRKLHGNTPMGMLKTEAGARLIEELLYQIDYGMVA